MNKERLLKLAALLDIVPKGKFDMDHWGRSAEPMGSAPQCATAACALGWATAIPEFSRAGLELVARRGDEFATVRYCGRTDEEAGERFFSLTEYEARELFLSGFDMTPRQKAAQIRAMVKAGF